MKITPEHGGRPGRAVMVCLWIILAAVAGMAAEPDGLQVVSSDAHALVFTLRTGDLRPVDVPGTHGGCRTFRSPVLDDAVIPGTLFLPGKSVLVALPPSGEITIRWTAGSRRTLTGIVPAMPISGVPENPPKFRPATSAPGFSVTSPVTRSAEGIVRGIRVVSLRITPFLYDAPAGILTGLDDLKIRVAFPAGASGTIPAHPGEADLFCRRMVLNPEQAAQWTIRPEKMHRTNPPRKETESATKIRVIRDGLYRVSDFPGLTVTDPRNIHVYNRGVEIPVRVVGEMDGVFDPGDYLEFYGEAYRSDTDDSEKYTAENIYRVTVEDSFGLRTPERDVAPGTETIAGAYAATRRIEENTVYFNEEFLWNIINYHETSTYTIHLDAPAACDTSPVLRFRFTGVSSLADINPDHRAEITLNGVKIADIIWDGYADVTRDISLVEGLLHDGDNEIAVFSRGSEESGEIDSFGVDWFEIVYPRGYLAEGSGLTFCGPCESLTGSCRYRVSGFDSPEIILYRTDPVEMLTGGVITPGGQGFRLEFTGDAGPDTRFLAVPVDAVSPPDRVWADTPSHWKSPDNGADYVIISHADFIPALAPLVEYHAGRGRRVAVVDVEDIYDEFNNGIFNPEAIRAFCRYAYEQWEPPAPSYLLLVGDASWDYRNQLPGSIKHNFVPSFGKNWTEKSAGGMDPRKFLTAGGDFIYGYPMVDDQFVCVDGDDDFPDMAMGRIPAETPQQVADMVTKTLAYHRRTQDKGWQKRLLFITGGVGDEEQEFFTTQSENILNLFDDSPWWHLREINKETDDYEFGVYEQDIIDAIDAGTLIVNFLGHAGTWSWEAMFDFDDIPKLANGDRLPFIGSFTCNTCRFANPEITSFCERFVLTDTPANGGVAAWGGCNFGGFWTDYYLAYYFYDALLGDRERNLGLTIMRTKIKTLGQYPSYAIILEPYTYLGDPALELDIPAAPEVGLSGLMNTRVSHGEGGTIQYLAWVRDPDGPDDIAAVELTVNGIPTGVFLRDDGAHGDFGAGDGIFGLQVDVPPGAASSGTVQLGVAAVDAEGNRGFAAPALTCW